MENEIVKIAIHPTILGSLEGISKLQGITIDKVIERAFSFYIGSHLVDKKVLKEFYENIAKVTFKKDR